MFKDDTADKSPGRLEPLSRPSLKSLQIPSSSGQMVPSYGRKMTVVGGFKDPESIHPCCHRRYVKEQLRLAKAPAQLNNFVPLFMSSNESQLLSDVLRMNGIQVRVAQNEQNVQRDGRRYRATQYPLRPRQDIET